MKANEAPLGHLKNHGKVEGPFPVGWSAGKCMRYIFTFTVRRKRLLKDKAHTREQTDLSWSVHCLFKEGLRCVSDPGNQSSVESGASTGHCEHRRMH